MGSAQGRDFFISYTASNRPWAEWIVVQLENAGWTTVSQAFDFAPGSDFVHEMQRAAVGSVRTIAVLSPAYLDSAFGEAEWRAAFARDPSGEKGLLIPVRVQPCEPPGLLATRVFVDLVDADERSARAVLLDTVARVRTRPTSAPYPGRSGRTRFPGAGPEVSNLPARNRNFSGRDRLLGQIHTDLRAGSTAAVVSAEAIHGLGGIGKTDLATEYGHRFGSDYDIAWWIPAQEPATAAGALAALARKLGIAESAGRPQLIADLFDELRGRDRWLLVYDNAEQPGTLEGLLPPAGAGHVLVTSRWSQWARHATPLRLGVMSRDESVGFLRGFLGLVDPSLDELTDLAAIADLLGDLPLALDEAAAFLAVSGCGSRQYIGLLRDRSRELFGLNPSDGDPDQRRVGTVWSLSLDRVRGEEPIAEALLNLFAFLAPDIPRDLPVEAPEALPVELAAIVDPLVYNRALSAIGRYSLATVTPGTVGVHRLVQEVIRARLDVAAERSWAEAAIKLLRTMFPHESWEPVTWPACERLLPQVLAAVDHAERLDFAGFDAGSLLGKASIYLREHGQYQQAEPIARRGADLTETALGPNHVEVGRQRNELARALKDLGDVDSARIQQEQALRIVEAALGRDHAEVGTLRNNLGLILLDTGNAESARLELEEAVRISLTALGHHHPDTGRWRTNLGTVLYKIGDLDGARIQHEEAVRISQATLGPDHPDTGRFRSNFGLVLHDLGDLDGARIQHEEALRITLAVLGPDHRYISNVRNNLGSVLQDLGDCDSALTELEEALRIGLAALGPDHPDIGIPRNNLGSILHDQGDLDGARSQLEEALRVSVAALGPDHPQAIQIRQNLETLNASQAHEQGSSGTVAVVDDNRPPVAD